MAGRGADLLSHGPEDEKAGGEGSSQTETEFDEKADLKQEPEPKDKLKEIRRIEQETQRQPSLDRGATQESIRDLLTENPDDAGSSQVPEKPDEVDNEVRSIIDQFKDAAIDEEAEEQEPGPEFKQLQHNLTQGNASRVTESKDESSAQVSAGAGTNQSPGSPSVGRATNLTSELHRKSLPPAPEPELRFNFHLFLEQLKHRTADPVARYLRSFLIEFGKKQWSVNEQVRIISDFLSFITGKMSQCEIWAGNTETEFDNATEGMEKLVMTRLYTQIFSPEIPPPPLAADARGRKRPQKSPQQGRRGQHQEDVERDHLLAEKMQIFSWVEEKHLDIPAVPLDSRRFLSLAQQELSKVNNYRAPRDKVICVMNACKVIFGLLKSSEKADTSADSFMPLLIYTVLRARPRDMVSNIQYIFRFRNQDKLNGEAGYYLSSLMGAVQFIENLDRTALTISDEDFEKHVEASVAAIAEKQKPVTPRTSLQEPRRGDDTSASRSPARLLATDAAGPVQDIIRNIQRPLSNLGRMFSDETQEHGQRSEQSAEGQQTTRAATTSQAVLAETQTVTASGNVHTERPRRTQPDVDVDSIVDTLSSMFPTLDRDVISDIVIAKQARVGAAVDACLALTS